MTHNIALHAGQGHGVTLAAWAGSVEGWEPPEGSEESIAGLRSMMAKTRCVAALALVMSGKAIWDCPMLKAAKMMAKNTCPKPLHKLSLEAGPKSQPHQPCWLQSERLGWAWARGSMRGGLP